MFRHCHVQLHQIGTMKTSHNNYAEARYHYIRLGYRCTK